MLWQLLSAQVPALVTSNQPFNQLSTMAKRNPYWAKQKGKLGETVFSVVKGEQVQRAYNGSPANPKTRGQTLQRVKFACAVKFFKSLDKKQLKFAYDDRKKNESDYNAFMRHNVGISGIYLRDFYLDPRTGGYGPFLLTQGPLKPFDTQLQQSGDITTFFHKQAPKEPKTLGEVAAAFKQGYNLLDGDIITIVYSSSGLQQPQLGLNGLPLCRVVQMEVGKVDNRPLPKERESLYIEGHRDYILFKNVYISMDMVGVILSRPTKKGLLVSTCKMTMNGMCNGQWNLYRGRTDLTNEVLDSWGATDPAVLEGGYLPE